MEIHKTEIDSDRIHGGGFPYSWIRLFCAALFLTWGLILEKIKMLGVYSCLYAESFLQ